MPLSLFENDTKHAVIERRLPFGGIGKNAMRIAFSNGGAMWKIYHRLKKRFSPNWRNARLGMEIAEEKLRLAAAIRAVPGDIRLAGAFVHPDRLDRKTEVNA